MNVMNCRKCGKLYNYISGDHICPGCREKMEQKFQEVKDFVRQNKNTTMHEVCEACEVSPNQIQNWIRQERLQFSDDSPIKVSCEACGTMITSGKYCDKCKNELARGLNNMLTKPASELQNTILNKNSQNNKMRFLNK